MPQPSLVEPGAWAARGLLHRLSGALAPADGLAAAQGRTSVRRHIACLRFLPLARRCLLGIACGWRRTTASPAGASGLCGDSLGQPIEGGPAANRKELLHATRAFDEPLVDTATAALVGCPSIDCLTQGGVRGSPRLRALPRGPDGQQGPASVIENEAIFEARRGASDVQVRADAFVEAGQAELRELRRSLPGLAAAPRARTASHAALRFAATGGGTAGGCRTRAPARRSPALVPTGGRAGGCCRGRASARLHEARTAFRCAGLGRRDRRCLRRRGRPPN
mmetsp:Transcript_13287/g.38186  ORF Transcript_13287/g.38186 Transcript_13287/m.38186 type:complete len:280 (-) Transcript_13287:96-935(-)